MELEVGVAMCGCIILLLVRAMEMEDTLYSRRAVYGYAFAFGVRKEVGGFSVYVHSKNIEIHTAVKCSWKFIASGVSLEYHRSVRSHRAIPFWKASENRRLSSMVRSYNEDQPFPPAACSFPSSLPDTST